MLNFRNPISNKHLSQLDQGFISPEILTRELRYLKNNVLYDFQNEISKWLRGYKLTARGYTLINGDDYRKALRVAYDRHTLNKNDPPRLRGTISTHLSPSEIMPKKLSYKHFYDEMQGGCDGAILVSMPPGNQRRNWDSNLGSILVGLKNKHIDKLSKHFSDKPTIVDRKINILIEILWQELENIASALHLVIEDRCLYLLTPLRANWSEIPGYKTPPYIVFPLYFEVSKLLGGS